MSEFLRYVDAKRAAERATMVEQLLSIAMDEWYDETAAREAIQRVIDLA